MCFPEKSSQTKKPLWTKLRSTSTSRLRVPGSGHYARTLKNMSISLDKASGFNLIMFIYVHLLMFFFNVYLGLFPGTLTVTTTGSTKKTPRNQFDFGCLWIGLPFFNGNLKLETLFGTIWSTALWHIMIWSYERKYISGTITSITFGCRCSPGTSRLWEFPSCLLSAWAYSLKPYSLHIQFQAVAFFKLVSNADCGINKCVKTNDQLRISISRNAGKKVKNISLVGGCLWCEFGVLFIAPESYPQIWNWSICQMKF